MGFQFQLTNKEAPRDVVAEDPLLINYASMISFHVILLYIVAT